MAARLILLLAAATACLAAPAPAAKCHHKVQNPSFEDTSSNQDQVSVDWTATGSHYYFNNSQSDSITTPYGNIGLALTPEFCDQSSVASTALCLSTTATHSMTYAYNLYEVASSGVNQVEALRLIVKYAGKKIDTFSPPIPQGTNDVWATRTVSFKPAKPTGKFEFIWGIVPLSCPDNTVQSSLFGLDAIQVVETST